MSYDISSARANPYGKVEQHQGMLVSVYGHRYIGIGALSVYASVHLAYCTLIELYTQVSTTTKAKILQ